MARKLPVTKNFGFHLKVKNIQFKADQPQSRLNQKWILIPGLFESIALAQMASERLYPGVKNHIEGARVNISISPEILAEMKDNTQKLGKRMVKKPETTPVGGLKKNPTPMKKRVVEVIKRTFRNKKSDSSDTVKGLKNP
jgi:hypothetical protein